MELSIFLFQILNIFLVLFWIWIIVDCARRKFDSESEKIWWMLAVTFLPILASVAYLILVKYKKSVIK